MRKVLSFVLVLALVLSSFSMAFAADTATNAGLSDIAGTANEDAIQVCNDLGIIDGYTDSTFKPTNGVTRAEFAAMMTRALAIPSTALAGYTGTSFKDTTGYGWAVPYLAFCESKGIMLGDGNGYVRPGDPINVNEAVTMALRAVGYTANSAMLTGIWPANYVSIAQNEGLYDDVADVVAVDRQNAAQIIYNLLTVQKVAVNSDGETKDLLTSDKLEANLLNTGLGCVSDEGYTITGTDYDAASMNITPIMGAYGTKYTKDVDGVADDAIVAFTKDSTALTGKIDGDNFKVGDKKYDFEITTAKAIKVMKNTDVERSTDVISSRATATSVISKAAFDFAEDQKNVTINVDLSGNKIKEVYSIVAWKATETDLAAADVQEDIADNELLNLKFALDDNDNIINAGFKLVGVTSLDKIAENNVVYTYESDDDDVIRMVAVGTEIVEGTADELDDVNSVVTISEKDYDLATLDGKVKIDNVEPGDAGKLYLDAYGEAYKWDATTHKADTYGVVVSFDDQEDEDMDNSRIRLYLSSDEKKTFTLADDYTELDFVSASSVTTRVAGSSAGAIGHLLGYSLDAAGDIDTFDLNVAQTDNGDFQSTKVFKDNTKSFDINADCPVFTYEGTFPDATTLDAVSLDKVNKGDFSATVEYVFNDDDEVLALLIPAADADADNDDVYAVFNSRTTVLNTDDEKVFKFKGFIDGSEFTKLTDDDASAYNNFAGSFGVYAVKTDADDVITGITNINSAYRQETNNASNGVSGLIVFFDVKDVNSDKTVLTAKGTNEKWSIESDAVVYCYDADDEVFTVSSLSKIKKNYTVGLYDTDGDDADGVADVVIFQEDK